MILLVVILLALIAATLLFGAERILAAITITLAMALMIGGTVIVCGGWIVFILHTQGVL